MRYLIGFLASFGLMVLLVLIGGGIGAYQVAENWIVEEDLPESIILEFTLSNGMPEVGNTSPISNVLLYGKQASLLDIVIALEEAADDQRVRGVIANVARAALDLAEAQELRSALSRFRATGKFAHVFTDGFDETGASAIYYLATAFDRIIMQPSGLFDVRGISINVPLLRRLLDRHGVRAELLARHEYKSVGMFLTEEQLPETVHTNLRRAVSSLYDQLISGIATSRNLNPAIVRSLIDSAPLVGPVALRNSLVDELAYWNQAIKMARKMAPEAEMVGIDRYLLELDGEEVDHRIAVISAEGEIHRSASNPFEKHGVVTPDRMMKAVREAREDETVKAIIFRVDSPGGSYVASDTILQAFRQARESGIPVIVSMSGLAASGGYFIALSSDRIVAHPATITGSIGVVGGKITIAEMLKRHGVVNARISAGANADMYFPLTPFTEAQRAKVAEVLDWIYNDFITRVAESRRLVGKDLDRAARGRIWTGEDARKLGLVDVLGGYEEAVVLARQLAGLKTDEPTQLMIFPRRKGRLENLLETLESADLPSLMSRWRDLGFVLDYAVTTLASVPLSTNANQRELRAPPIQVR